MKQKQLVIFSALFLVLAFVAGAMYYRSQKEDAAVQAYRQNKSAFIGTNAPAFGNPDAKVDLVEFFDPACDTCRAFYPYVKQLMAAHPDQIRLYMRYAAFHPGSDYVIKILEAAHRQGKFRETLEAVFAAQEQWAPNHQPRPELVWNYIGGIGLDIKKLREDMELPEMNKIVQQGLADANKVGVKATPEFFVNGKPLPSFGYEQLKTLVDAEVAAQY